MNLEGRIPFVNVLCYQTRAPVFQKAFLALPMAMERQAGSDESGRVSSTEGVHVFLFS